jgi:hypothetical protein
MLQIDIPPFEAAYSAYDNCGDAFSAQKGKREKHLPGLRASDSVLAQWTKDSSLAAQAVTRPAASVCT